MKVLVTGFEPFGGEKVNPALEAVKLLPKEINGAQVVVRELPTVFRKSLEVLFSEIEKENPDVVICVGQAGGRFAISIERVAINVDDARIPDNEGNQPIDQPIFPDGENAYFSTLPIKRIVEAIAIVTKGRIKQSVFGDNGREKILYFLQPGEIFGEFAYLGGGEDMIVGQAMECSEISVLFEKELERIFMSNPEAYKYIAHSMARKFRILMMQLCGLLFKDSLGRLCDVLLRLCCQQEKVLEKGHIIDIPLTHENIAQLIGCDRVTVTKGLNRLKKEGIIEISQKKILIKKIEKLEEFVG